MKPPDDLGLVHVFVPALSPGAALLGVRGKVLENGMPRFFRRFAEGVFDVDDLKNRTNEFAEFIDVASEHYGFSKRHLIAGRLLEPGKHRSQSDISPSSLLGGSGALSSDGSFHPGYGANFNGLAGFLAGGVRDSIVPHDQTEHLAAILQSRQADVSLFWHRGGHELGDDDTEAAKAWFTVEVIKKLVLL
jgi:predicted esterase